MTDSQGVHTCRWGIPTLFLEWPLWCEASQHEWSCTRDSTPTILTDPAVCRSCPYWTPRVQAAAGTDVERSPRTASSTCLASPS
jgi:hypothetical protein